MPRNVAAPVLREQPRTTHSNMSRTASRIGPATAGIGSGKARPGAGGPVNFHDTGRVDATDCGEFMARHSDFMDGLLPTLAAARLRAHVESCSACARYDRVVRKGIDLVRDIPAIQPSSDFEQRLQHRLYHLEDGDLLRQRPATGAAATLLVAAVIALLAWSPVVLQDGLRTGAAGSASLAGTGADTDFSDVDYVPVAAGSTPAFMDAGTWYPLPAPYATRLAAFPGPYSPLVVTPPAHRAVRTVSSDYAPIE
jgi:hypothetical protein